jgi:fimbrial isopeptide formation D2 family protein/uncharacterized repeat protein (TIGR01451 family)
MLTAPPRNSAKLSLSHIRPLLVAAMLLSGSWFGICPLLAQSAKPGTIITNQATGSFIDELESNTTVPIVSNTVQVTVVEVAGITIADPTISEPSAATIGATATPFQGIAGFNQDDILYFDFVITNIGNDPTQFFIPGQPFQVIGGTFDRTQYGALQIVEVNGTSIPKIDIPAAGINTGSTTLGIPGGSIPVGGTVKVRIPIKVTAASGSTVKVSLGDTGTNDNGVGTINQTYTASATPGADVRTQDNADNTSIDTPIIGESNDVPNGGEKEASRFGSVPIVATPQVVGFKSAKLTDANGDNKINPGETVTWTIDYVNTGTLDVSDFQIVDVLPVNVTKSGAVVLTSSGTGQTAPILNTTYMGTNTTPGTTDRVLDAPVVLKSGGGAIRVTIPVTINTGFVGSLSNQATATGIDLPIVGIKTDNVGKTSDLPTDIKASPYNLTVPAASIAQTTTLAIDPTIITVENSIPNLLLVKRITGLNGLQTKRNGDSLAAYDEDTTNPYDDNDNTPPTVAYPQKATDKWPDTTSHTSSTFLLGARDGGTILPNDTIEYTIYFLSAGYTSAKGVSFCDRVPDKVTFIPSAFNGLTAGNTNLIGDRGIAVNLGGTINSYTNVADGDFAQYFPLGSTLPSICGTATNTNGAVVVNLGEIPNATAVGTPGSYGFVRFQGRVK